MSAPRPMKPIPVTAAKHVATEYGYDQVIIIARRLGAVPHPYGEQCTTYGVDRAHGEAAGRCGNYLKRRVIGWHDDQANAYPDYAAVDRFAEVMKGKMATKSAQGYGGWDDKADCTAEELTRLLRRSVEKGDPVDVANFAMMLHQRGETILPTGDRTAGAEA